MKRLYATFFICVLMASFIISFNKLHAEETYPVRPISFVIPMEAGADPDILLRPWAEKVSKILGQPIVIVNKPGGPQTIGYREVHGAKPDGYTFGACVATIFLAKMQGLFSYDLQDFTPLSLLVKTYPIITASKKTDHPFTTMQEVISYAKANPGKIKAATSARGAPSWLTSQLVQQATDVKFNIIPQEGVGSTIMSQVLGGHTDLGFAYMAAARAQIDAGTIRCLAVVGPDRFPGKYNNIPTLKEIGYDAGLVLWIGVIGPANMPKEITNKLEEAFQTASQDTEIKNFWLSRNFFPGFLPSTEFSDFADNQKKMFRDLLEEAGIKTK